VVPHYPGRLFEAIGAAAKSSWGMIVGFSTGCTDFSAVWHGLPP